MRAQKPEECDILLMETMNRGDLEAAVALYEPSAVLVPRIPRARPSTGMPRSASSFARDWRSVFE